MQLHKPGFLNSLGKRIARPLSTIACSPLALNPSRALNAYLNFLLGKGSGTGWDISHEIDVARSTIRRPRPVVLDVGANVGEWTSLFLEASPEAKVFMFEPSPTCQAEIRKRSLQQAILIPCAVGEQPGKADLYFSSDTDGTASLHERTDSYFSDLEYKAVEVEVTSIDSIIDKYELDFVDFVKIDIEGHELFALKGAVKAIQANKIGALSFEFGSGNINSRTYFKDFWNLLTGSGFALSRMTPGGSLVPIDHYYEDLEYFRGVSNYLAVSKNPAVAK